VRASPLGPSGGLVLEVADTGPGIAETERDRVFERFTRGGTAGAADGGTDGGTGLGLANARWAVELHGGRIAVVDGPPGCCIRVTLPAS
jgi:signal transduction histidine kinase